VSKCLGLSSANGVKLIHFERGTNFSKTEQLKSFQATKEDFNNSKLIQPSSHTPWFTFFIFIFKTLHVSATNYSAIIRCFNNTKVKGTQIYKVFKAK
jgi:hypothetical protein